MSLFFTPLTIIIKINIIEQMFVGGVLMKEGITAYIIESNRKIRKVTVAHVVGNMALVKFDEGGGIRVHLSRLFESEDAARKYLSIRENVINIIIN